MQSKDKCLKEHFNFKGNQWEEKDNFFIGTDAKGNQFKISKEDYEECSQHCWTSNPDRSPKIGTYFSARMSRKSAEGHKMKMLHNFVWTLHNGEIPSGYMVDHIDRDGSNCCIDNLRLATKSQNTVNRDLTVKNTSGITGVCYDKKTKKWRSFITINRKRIEFKYQANKDDAIKLRLQAEKEYFGEFAPQKHLFEKYGIEVDK